MALGTGINLVYSPDLCWWSGEQDYIFCMAPSCVVCLVSSDISGIWPRFMLVAWGTGMDKPEIKSELELELLRLNIFFKPELELLALILVFY